MYLSYFHFSRNFVQLLNIIGGFPQILYVAFFYVCKMIEIFYFFS